MSRGLTIEKQIQINASPAKVWNVITDPAKVKQYMFGTDMTADWKVGGKITYKGSWEGREYEDGGTILEIEPEKILKSTYWSSMSGAPNTPENQMVVTYKLEPQAGGTLMTVIQDNNKTEEGAEHSGSNWQMVLESMKKLAEN